jgi:tetratricopeptide (TPR) repeat protein
MNKVKNKPKTKAATGKHLRQSKLGNGKLPNFATENNRLCVGVILACLLASIFIATDKTTGKLHHDDAVLSSSSSSSAAPLISTTNNKSNSLAFVNNIKQHSQYVAHIHNLLAANQASLAMQQVVQGQEIYEDSIPLSMLLGISHVTLNQCPAAIQAYSRALTLISKQQQQTTSAENQDDSLSHGIFVSRQDLADYKIKAMIWIGVCHRRLGNAQQAIQWLEASVALSTTTANEDENGHMSSDGRESRHQLAHSYLAQARYVDSAEQLAVIFQPPKSSSSVVKNAETATDADYYLLSIILSTMEEWPLLEQALSHCLAHACSLTTTGYPAAQIHVEHALALQQCGRGPESLVQLQKAADLLATGGDGTNNSMVRVREMAHAYLQSSRQRSQQQRAEASSPFDQEKWQSVVQSLWNSTRNTPTAWSIIKHRHVQGFNYPIPIDLLDQVDQEIKEDQGDALLSLPASSSTHKIPTFTTLPNRTAPCVNHYTCLQLSMYSLENCIFYAQVQSARLQQHLIRTQKQHNSINVMTYSDFNRDVYPTLDNENPATSGSTRLHIGIYTADLRAHPMLPLIRTFLKYTSLLRHEQDDLMVKVTLYHTAADAAILQEMKQYMDHDDNMVACTREAWQDCVQHARQHQVQVWLETTGRTGTCIRTCLCRPKYTASLHID